MSVADRTITTLTDADLVQVIQVNAGGLEAYISAVNFQDYILESLDESKLVTTDGTNTLTNKTITSPKIGTSTEYVTLSTATQTHASPTLTIPDLGDASDTVLLVDLAQTISNKTIVLKNTAVVNAVAATAVLTSDNTEVADGDTVTIGTTIYRFKDTPAQAYDIKRHGTTADTTMGNLIKAINATGTEGVEYYAGTLIHPTVSAGTLGSHAFTVTAKTKGVAGNLIAKSESSDHLDWDGTGAYLTGGVDGTVGVAGEIRNDLANSKLWICAATNTIADANWHPINWSA